MAQCTQADPRKWGSQFWLRNEAHTRMSCASPTSTHRVAQAGVGLCAFVSRAFEKRPSSRGPFTGRRISLRVLVVSSRTLTTAPVVSQLIVSNRSARRLELPESYRKQTTAPLSNRHKFTHRPTTSHPICSVGRPPIRWQSRHCPTTLLGAETSIRSLN